MRKATSAGVYALDRDAAERLRRALRARGSAARAYGQPPRQDGGLHTRRRELLLAIGRHERALDEALRGLSPADGDRAHDAGLKRDRQP